MKLNLSKETLLQIDAMSKIKGGGDGTLLATNGSSCTIKVPDPPPMPLDTPCNHAAWSCPQPKP